MTFGANTVTVPVNSVNKVLVRINQNNFGSTYYLRETLQEFTLNVRHSQEALMADGTRFDRHNVELIHTVFPTETAAGQTRVSYAVFRNKRGDVYADVQDSFAALTGLLSESAIAELLAWSN